MPDASPWDSISTPDADFNVLQVDGDRAVACYWGRDKGGSCLFIVELYGDHASEFRKNTVVVNGLSVDLRSGKPGYQRLVLMLDRQVDRDLFENLCRALATALTPASDSSTALAITLAHLKRWKLFLAGRGGQNLSADAVRGLFAELVFLRELIEAIGSDTAVEAWLGPERSHQDFVFGNTAIEIKSLSGAERSEVGISSEDQLEALNDHLFLRIYRLSALTEVVGAVSLNGIIAMVQSELASAEALVSFDRKLITHGYAPLSEYDDPKFSVSDVRTFKIGEGFPRLIRSEIPAGTAKVSYSIRLEAIEAFKADNASVFGGA
ncbi:MAG TPA: PD-(D/E)XK motif protein [Sphingobium sp.]|uniref:PD-(D/E)XK motif protein n=1 Tax=Sphingobium sp. TaxID=1912891 RepID=UPI002ED1C6C4